jgi:hypothetical protein
VGHKHSTDNATHRKEKPAFPWCQHRHRTKQRRLLETICTLSRRHQSEPSKQKTTLTSAQVFIALYEKVGESKKLHWNDEGLYKISPASKMKTQLHALNFILHFAKNLPKENREISVGHTFFKYIHLGLLGRV